MKPRTPPRSVRILNQWVDSYGRQLGQPPARVRNWLSHVVLGGALETAGFEGAERKFTIKGGVALEMRLRHLARATKDLDLILNSASGNLIEELEGALSRPYQGFTFRRKGQPEIMPNGAARVEVALQYLGKSWGTVQVDVARHEGDGAEVEMVEAISLAPFGIAGPEALPCLSLPYHIAQKIHGMTLPPQEGRRNDRFRDLVDLLLLREWVSDFDAVQRACHVVFESRGTHPWPPFFDPPERWADQFKRMASDMALPVTDLYDAAIEIRRFITQIDESAEWMAELPSLDGLRATTWYFAFGPDGALHRIPAYIGESFFTGRRGHNAKVLPEWQRVPGGLALIGVVLFLRARKAVFVQGVSAKGFALAKTVAGERIEFGPDVWDALALELLRQTRAPVRAVNGLSIFLSNVPCRLPCVVALTLAASTAQAHWWRTNWKWDWLLWDLDLSRPVRGGEDSRTIPVERPSVGPISGAHPTNDRR